VVVEDGREIQRKEIVVNDPLVYRGVRFYQASYGPTGKLDQLMLTAISSATPALRKDLTLGLNETAVLDPDTTVKLDEFIPDYVVRDNQVYTRSNDVTNPAVHLIVTSNRSGKSVNFWLPPLEGFAENGQSPYQFEVQDLKLGYFTGLEVSHEPGQWAVWTGVVLMGIGLTFVFYVAHTRFWAVPVRDAKGKLELWVGGTANRNREAFEERFRELTEKIETELKSLRETGATARVVSIA
jgi:cytochrome c biogenesis protein